MDNKQHRICCPKCGQEYLPAEIYFPQDVFGRPSNIIRDAKGKIEFYTGDSFNLKEEFVCINCDCEFVVEGEVKFVTKESDKPNFDEDHVTTLYSDRTILEEN